MKTLFTLLVALASLAVMNAQAPPTPVTLPPDSITSTSARLHGTLETNDETAAHLTCFDFEIGNQMVPLYAWTPTYYPGNAHGTISVTNVITDLVPGMIYHYRAEVAYCDIGGNSSRWGERVLFVTLSDSAAKGLILPILFEESSGQSRSLFFGAHTLATECLDERFGEYEVPPPPPTGCMDVRFRRYCFGQGANLDVRGFRSESQIDTFVLRVQLGDPGCPLRISWPDVNDYYTGPVTLNLGVQSIDMKQVRSVVLDEEPPRVWVITQGPVVSAQYPCVTTNAPPDSVQADYHVTGVVNPNGIPTTAWFEWGTSTSYEHATDAQSVGSAIGAEEFQDLLNGLSVNTMYHFRAVARNSAGVMYGADQMLRVLGPTGVNREALAPAEFALQQNYPNPFNPSTLIHYELPGDVMVRLVVYDILGREVATLANERKQAGKYDVAFNAAALSSGIYVYRMQAGDFVSMKKMLFLK